MRKLIESNLLSQVVIKQVQIIFSAYSYFFLNEWAAVDIGLPVTKS